MKTRLRLNIRNFGQLNMVAASGIIFPREMVKPINTITKWLGMFITAVSLFAVFILIEIDASDKVKDTVRSAFVDGENEDFLSPEFYQRGNCLGYYISTGNGNIYKTYYDDRYDVYGCGEDEVFKTKKQVCKYMIFKIRR